MERCHAAFPSPALRSNWSAGEVGCAAGTCSNPGRRKACCQTTEGMLKRTLGISDAIHVARRLCSHVVALKNISRAAARAIRGRCCELCAPSACRRRKERQEKRTMSIYEAAQAVRTCFGVAVAPKDVRSVAVGVSRVPTASSARRLHAARPRRGWSDSPWAYSRSTKSL
jgi:hypothetical protein